MTTARSNRYFRARKKKAGKAEAEPAFITMDMPEVKDIPGQEHIRPPRMQEMMDITASSADEEGEGVLDDLNTGQNEDMGSDPDVPGAGPDDGDEAIGDEDEKNNPFSLPD